MKKSALFNSEVNQYTDVHNNNAFIKANDQLKGLDTKYPIACLVLISEMMTRESGSDDWFTAARALDRIAQEHPLLVLPLIIKVLEHDESAVLKDCVSPILSYLVNRHHDETMVFFKNSIQQSNKEREQILCSLLERYCYSSLNNEDKFEFNIT